MPEYVRPRPRRWSEWAYRLILRAYPREFRNEFGDAMIEFFRDRMARARSEGRRSVRARVWWRAMIDVMREAPAARADVIRDTLASRRTRRALARHTPSLQRSRREENMLSSVLQDLRYAVRGMRRAPGFTATVLSTLALGIGANVAIFSVVNGVLLRALPYDEPAGIVRIDHRDPFTTVSEPEFVDYRRDATSLQRLAAFRKATVTLTGEQDEPERAEAALVSEDFFRILGTRPLRGRAFTPDEDRRGGPPVVVLGEGLWRRRFGADSTIIGKAVIVNARPRTVVGVMPARFTFPDADVAMWAPLRLNYDTLWTRNNHYLQMIGRLAPGASPVTASADINRLARRFTSDFPDTYVPGRPLTASVRPLSEALVSRTRPYLFALLGAVAFVLLIGCVNVANLLLARGETRRKELAIRTAMGASRARVVRQALTESLFYALGGGTLGVLLAVWGVRALRSLGPADVPRLDEVRLDGTVLAFACLVSIVTGVVFGLLPALRSMRDDGGEALKEGGKTSTAQARGQRRARGMLVGAEVALAVVMLSGAGLLLRSLWNLQSVEVGFRPDHVLSVRITPPGQTYVDDKAIQFWNQLTSRVRAVPTVEAVAAVEDLPVADGNSIWSILVDGAPMTSVASAPSAMPQKVTTDYFAVMRIPIVSGRAFTDADRADALLVAVINETMARKLWSGKNPLGGTVKMLNATAPWATVVGVVRDVRSAGLQSEIPPTMYFPQAQAGRSAFYVPSPMALVVRTAGDPRAITGAVRKIVHDLEPLAPVSRVQTMDEIIAASVGSRRFATQLIAGFAAVALLLAGIGIYGVMSYTVNQRMFEIGLRMALGARRRQVILQIVGDGLRTAGIGAIVGVVGAIAATRAVRSLFVGVSPTDPLTLGTVVVMLVAVAMLAAYAPARRATGADPLRSLRAE